MFQAHGGHNERGRPFDALLPCREYVPKRRAWEGSGTASKEGIVVPLMREKVEGGLEQSPAACSEHAADGEQADGDTPVTETVKLEHIRWRQMRFGVRRCRIRNGWTYTIEI